jgi:hypothetical protein
MTLTPCDRLFMLSETLPKRANRYLSHIREYHSDDEARAAHRLIRLLVKRNYSVSVNDGAEWVLKRSTSIPAILSAMGTTSEDHLIIRDPSGEIAGWFNILWGNSGEELIADHSGNEICESLWKEWASI